MFRRLLRHRWLRLALGLLLLSGLLVAGANAWLLQRARRHIYTDLRTLPENEVAIVLGTAPRVAGGRVNLFFKGRIDAAAALYRAGKVRHFLLSGDNGRREYDEPAAMRAALLARGVPEAAMTVDDAGFRTLDTMARATRVFGLTRATIVTDDFHEARALFLAESFGLSAVGYPSPRVPLRSSKKTRLREIAGRTVAVLDVYLFRTQPHFYGPREQLHTAGT